jgi:fumarate reductase flavoprotein subunit
MIPEASKARFYNSDAEQGQHSAFFKGGSLVPILEPPFYGVEIRPAILCWTGTGLKINADTQILDAAREPISVLYAAGETVGNLHGDRYIGGGGSFGPCIVFGKVAGEHAQHYVAGLNQ